MRADCTMGSMRMLCTWASLSVIEMPLAEAALPTRVWCKQADSAERMVCMAAELALEGTGHLPASLGAGGTRVLPWHVALGTADVPDRVNISLEAADDGGICRVTSPRGIACSLSRLTPFLTPWKDTDAPDVGLVFLMAHEIGHLMLKHAPQSAAAARIDSGELAPGASSQKTIASGLAYVTKEPESQGLEDAADGVAAHIFTRVLGLPPYREPGVSQAASDAQHAARLSDLIQRIHRTELRSPAVPPERLGCAIRTGQPLVLPVRGGTHPDWALRIARMHDRVATGGGHLGEHPSSDLIVPDAPLTPVPIPGNLGQLMETMGQATAKFAAEEAARRESLRARYAAALYALDRGEWPDCTRTESAEPAQAVVPPSVAPGCLSGSLEWRSEPWVEQRSSEVWAIDAEGVHPGVNIDMLVPANDGSVWATSESARAVFQWFPNRGEAFRSALPCAPTAVVGRPGGGFVAVCADPPTLFESQGADANSGRLAVMMNGEQVNPAHLHFGRLGLWEDRVVLSLSSGAGGLVFPVGVTSALPLPAFASPGCDALSSLGRSWLWVPRKAGVDVFAFSEHPASVRVHHLSAGRVVATVDPDSVRLDGWTSAPGNLGRAAPPPIVDCGPDAARGVPVCIDARGALVSAFDAGRTVARVRTPLLPGAPPVEARVCGTEASLWVLATSTEGPALVELHGVKGHKAVTRRWRGASAGLLACGAEHVFARIRSPAGDLLRVEPGRGKK